MPKNHLPAPRMVLEPSHARRFLLAHQRLLPPRRLEGADGVMNLFHHLGCIQFDPIDIVGRNPDLVLQSRIADYRPSLLEELMYGERRLYVGWDKMAAIVQSVDWPSFARHRALMVKQHGKPETPEMKLAPFVLEEIRKRGPLSSRDIEHDATVDWWWGRKKRLVGASLEVLSAMGIVLVHHRVRSERYFDLAERILPAEILSAPDPHPADEDYQDWHVVRRIGSIGLAPATGAPEYWWGIMGVKGTAARAAVLSRLAERGDVVPVAVDGVPKCLFFLRAADLPTLESAGESSKAPTPAAVVSAVAAAAGAAFRLVSLYRRAFVGPGHRIRDQLRSTGRWRTVAPGRRSREPGASCRQQSGPASEANSPELARAVRPAFSAHFPRETDRVNGCLPQCGSTRRRVPEE